MATSKYLLLIVTVACIVVLTIFGTRLMNLQVNCLSSQFVEAVQFVSADGQPVMVQQCSLLRDLVYPQSLTLRQQQIVHRIHGLNVLTRFMPVPRTRKLIQILENDPFTVEMTPRVLRIGAELAAQEYQFQQNFLLFLLAARKNFAHSLESQVISQFLLRTESGVKWFDNLMSAKEYCLSDQRSLFAFQQCEATDEISTAALSPTLAKILILTEQMLPLSARIEMFRKVAIGWLPLSSWPKEFHDVFQVQAALNLFIDQELASFTNLNESERNKMAEALRKQIRLNQPLQLLVEVNDPHLTFDRLPQLFKFSARFREASIVILQEKHMTFLPALHAAPRAMMPAEHYVYITCEMPTLAKLSEINSDRVTVFRVCEGDQNLNWDRILISQIDRHVPLNTEFVRLHIPSLKAALQQKPALKALRVNEVALLSEKLFWQRNPWNQKDQMFEPKGPSNAITAYRLTHH